MLLARDPSNSTRPQIRLGPTHAVTGDGQQPVAGRQANVFQFESVLLLVEFVSRAYGHHDRVPLPGTVRPDDRLGIQLASRMEDPLEIPLFVDQEIVPGTTGGATGISMGGSGLGGGPFRNT